MFRAFALAVGAAVLAGCSAGSGDLGGSVGGQGGKAPVAVILSVGHPQESDGTVVVRSGAEVLLSGEDSDSRDAPILSFEWEGLDPAAQQVMSDTVLRPTANAIKFPAPPVPVGQEANLGFRLTVTNSRGQSGTRDITVRIQGASDPGSFLTYPQKETSELVVVAALKPGAAAPGADTFLRVVMRQEVAYEDKLGRPRTLVLPEIVRYGAWLAGHAPEPNCAADSNARMSFPMPALNADHINGAVQRAAYAMASGEARRSKLDEEIYLVDIDQARLAVRFELTASGTEPVVLDASLQDRTRLCVMGIGGGGPIVVDSQSSASPTTLEDELDSLRNALNPSGDAFFDTRESALEYYGRVDPRGERGTLSAWLQLHGFDPSRRDFGAGDPSRGIVRAVYLNNYDLGFGREMYSRLICDSVSASPAPGECDVASVVLNYPSTEGAAKQLGAFVAVAMEYSRSELRGNCNPSVPGCVYESRNAARDDNAPRFTKFFVFAPDPRTGSFRRITSANLDGRGEKSVPQSCTACHGGVPYRTSANYLALAGKASGPEDVEAGFLPWDDDNLLFGAEDSAAFKQAELSDADEVLVASISRGSQAAAIKQLNRHAWLTYVDPGHLPGRFTDARALVEHWYGSGFTSTQQADARPPGWQSASADVYEGYARYCRTCHILQAPQSPELPGQYPFASFQSLQDRLASTAGGAEVIHAGLMPAARLSFDRFWSRTAGAAQSPGERFMSSLFPGEQIGPPGTPVPRIRVVGGAISRNSPTLVDGTASKFVAGFGWSAANVAGQSVNVRGSALNRASLALSGHCRPLNQDGSVRPASEDKVLLSLLGTNAQGQAETTEIGIPVENIQPAPRPVTSRTILTGRTTTFTLLDLFETTGGQVGDGVIDHVPTGCTGGNCIRTGDGVEFQPTSSQGSFNVLATDCDGETAVATASITVVDNPTANGRTWLAAANSSLALLPGGSILDDDSRIPDSVATLLLQSYSPVTECTVNPKRVDCGATSPGTSSSQLLVGATGQITYRPPRGVITRGASGKTTLPEDDSFQYRYSQNVGGETVLSNLTTERIQVTGSVKFASDDVNEPDIRGFLEANCTSCHGSSQAAVVPPAGQSGTTVYRAKTAMCLIQGGFQGGTGYAVNQCPSATEPRARESMRGSLLFQRLGGLRINIDQPENSLLVTKPSSTMHGGGQIAPPSSAFWDRLETWIGEGAWEN